MDRVSRRELDFSAAGRYKIREAWAHNFSFLAHASFHVPRWAIGLALNIKPSGIPVWQQEALVLLGLTSLPSGLICKESGRRRLKLDGQAVTHAFRDNLSAQLGLWPGFKLHMCITC